MMDSEGNRDTSPQRLPEACGHADDPCAMCKDLAGMRVVHSDELLQGQRELFILHGGQVYRLLRTRNDKLILQK